MNPAEAARSRAQVWVAALTNRGWQIPPLDALFPDDPAVLDFRARLPGTELTLDVSEGWVDRERLLTYPPSRRKAVASVERCTLEMARWHAQFGRVLHDRGARRLDVDRRKRPELLIHEHPFGQSNGFRLAVPHLPEPSVWLTRLEGLLLWAVED